MRGKLTSSLDEEEKDKEEKNGETLVGVIHSGSQIATIDVIQHIKSYFLSVK